MKASQKFCDPRNKWILKYRTFPVHGGNVHILSYNHYSWCHLFVLLQEEDAQPSDAPDEQSYPNLMQRPLAIAPIVPGQTVHAHASDKPKRPTFSTADISPADMALQVQLKAHREHQIKLKVNLILRTKTRIIDSRSLTCICSPKLIIIHTVKSILWNRKLFPQGIVNKTLQLKRLITTNITNISFLECLSI